MAFSYQWVSNDGTTDTDIQDATDSTYTLVDADEGKTIRVRVSFTDDAGNAESLTSGATDEVAARPNRIATGQPTTSGIAQVGETLTADTSGIADDDGLNNVAYSYQWIRNDGSTDTDIQEATDSAYTLHADDEGKTIKVRVTFTDDQGNQEALTSAPTEAVIVLIWSATLTADSSGTYSGYSLLQNTGALSPSEFSVGVADYTVRLMLEGDDGTLRFGLDRELPVPFTLHVGTQTLASEDTNPSPSEDEDEYTYRWDNRDVDWPIGGEVEVSLTMPYTPLTADFESAPSTHDGQDPFTFELRFSEEFDLSFKTLRDHAFIVTGGTVTKARRLAKPRNIEWEIHVQPHSNEDVTVVLPVTTDCDDPAAICTEDGRMLSSWNELTVPGTDE